MLADNMQSSSLRSFENIESYLSQDLLRVTAQNKGMYTMDRRWYHRKRLPEKTPRGRYSFCGGMSHGKTPQKLLIKIWGVFPSEMPPKKL